MKSVEMRIVYQTEHCGMTIEPTSLIKITCGDNMIYLTKRHIEVISDLIEYAEKKIDDKRWIEECQKFKDSEVDE